MLHLSKTPFVALRRLALLPLALILATTASAYADPVTVSIPVAPPLVTDGYGLCSASAVSDDPGGDFGPLDVNTYNGGINAFIEAREDVRFESVVRFELDLSNNNTTGTQASLGDFRAPEPCEEPCRLGGNPFFLNDSVTSFAARLRGFFNVTEELAGQPIHFGFYADDAVSLTVFDDSGNSFPVMVRPPQLGLPTWRLTETVTFLQPGLYAIEVLYVEVSEHAALEMSYFVGSFDDFERPASSPPIVELDDAGFLPMQPVQFHQAISGNPSFPDLDECQQCNRQFVGLPGNNICPSSYYCNEAALCAPCDTAEYCGPSCSPCGSDAQFCENISGEYQCIQCRDDDDCDSASYCEPDTNTCQQYECDTDEDCPRGEICVDRVCTTCDTADQCAGNSCNCCPVGNNGQQMQCAPLETDGLPVCTECTRDADCPEGVCDLSTGQCVDSLLPNHRPECCGDNCIACPDDVPYCLSNQIGGAACGECRSDVDCEDGYFCMSGQCLPCTYDKHCGPRCESCAGDQPFCLNGLSADRSFCVGCNDDSQCGPGETCNLDTYTCEPNQCAMSCPAETPYCYGGACVACYADTQCPCGGTCDLDTYSCSSSCVTNLDCLGVEHCRWDDALENRECVPGRMPASSNPCKSAPESNQPSKGGAPSPFERNTNLAAPPCDRIVTQAGCEIGFVRGGPDPGGGSSGAPWALALALGALLGLRLRAQRKVRQ